MLLCPRVKARTSEAKARASEAKAKDLTFEAKAKAEDLTSEAKAKAKDKLTQRCSPRGHGLGLEAPRGQVSVSLALALRRPWP